MTSNPTDLIERLRAFGPKLNRWMPSEWADDVEEAANTLTQQESELAEVRAERDALLQKPIDLAKMDSIDDDNGTPDKMIAYYWHQQAHDARAKSAQQERRIETLQLLLARYGDRVSMANAPRPEWQYEIDAALSTTTDAPIEAGPNPALVNQAPKKGLGPTGCGQG